MPNEIPRGHLRTQEFAGWQFWPSTPSSVPAELKWGLRSCETRRAEKRQLGAARKEGFRGVEALGYTVGMMCGFFELAVAAAFGVREPGPPVHHAIPTQLA